MLSLGFLGVVQSHNVWLDSLDLSAMDQDYSSPHKNRSVDDHELRIGGVTFAHGVGTHSNGLVTFKTDGKALRFRAFVGVDRETDTRGSVRFMVTGDGKQLFRSRRMRGNGEGQQVDVDLTGVRYVRLQVDDAGDGNDYDHADWADAYFTMKDGSKPVGVTFAKEPTMAIYHGFPDRPEINGPRTVGATPGRPFVFRIPVTGKGGVAVNVRNVPAGLTFDRERRILSGVTPKSGFYYMQVEAKSALGRDSRTITLVSGEHKLAQTPALGWNSWNVWGLDVDADKVRAAADVFIKSGLADAGFAFVNIDDGWEGGRSATGEIETNKKFGDMKSLGSYVHSLGLKLGIYSSPGPTTCGGYTASYEHEYLDAATYADWGVDYLKYDWCSYGGVEKAHGPSAADKLEYAQRPYILMRKALDKCSRDIVYSMCQYGMEDVYKWGKDIGGNSWRTTGDINDSWNSMAGIGFDHDRRSPYASPGGWNDPDMLVVGKLGWSRNIRNTKLTGNEQITHISLWCLLSSPLMIGCDLTKLDAFTKDVLMNHEVLAVNQDPLGKAARRIKVDGDAEVWARPLFDGSWAVGLFNRGYVHRPITISLKEIGLNVKLANMHNMWTRQDMPRGGQVTLDVPAHGAQLVRVSAR